MLPREHGAYGQLLFPLLTALAVARPGTAALALAGSAVAVFLAHEPLLVLLGQRGQRAAREQGVQARRWFAALAGAAVVLGALAVWRMPPPARSSLGLPIAFAVVLSVWIARHREHTTSGEIVSALSLASLGLPTSLAAGASPRAAWTLTLVFAISFVVATVSVRAMILYARRAAGAGTRAVAALVAFLGVAGMFLLARAGLTAMSGAVASVPVCAVGLFLAVWSPSPRHVRQIGWTLVAATLIAAVVLVTGLRGLI